MPSKMNTTWRNDCRLAAIIAGEIERQREEARIEGREMGDHIFTSRFLDRTRVARHSLSQALRRIILELPDDADHPDAEVIRSLKRDRPTPHSYRRSMSTGMAKLKIPKEFRQAVLAHVDDSVEGLHYNAHDYFDEKKMALDRWAAHVESLLSGTTKTGATVIAMRTRT